MPAHKNYGIGTGGINLVDSPLHLHDVQLLRAQNAELSLNEAEQGLVKRPALSALTAALSGSIHSIASIPLVLPTDPLVSGSYLYAPLAASWWRFLAPWPDSEAASPPTKVSLAGYLGIGTGICYYGDNATPDDIYQFDGTTEALVGTVPVVNVGATSNGAIPCTDGTALYATHTETLAGVAHVCCFQWTGAAWTQVGGDILDDATTVDQGAFVAADGTLFVATGGNTGGLPSRIYRWTGAAWALDYEFPDDVNALANYFKVVEFNGETYWACYNISIAAAALTQSLISRRTAAGVWSDVSPWTDGNCFGLVVHDSQIWALRGNDESGLGTFDGLELWSSPDGTYWAIDKDLTELVADAERTFGDPVLLSAYDSLFVIIGSAGGNYVARRQADGWTIEGAASGSKALFAVTP